MADHAAQPTQQAQHSQLPQQQHHAARFEVIPEHDGPAQHPADHAELQKLTQALREAEQRADAAELAVMTVQRTHTETVEQSARLQARTVCACILCMLAGQHILLMATAAEHAFEPSIIM